MSAYLSPLTHSHALSLSPCSILFLNFLYKRLREGEKTSEEKEEEEGEKNAIMDFIFDNPTPDPRARSPKKKKKTHIKPDIKVILDLKTRVLHTLTRKHTHTHARNIDLPRYFVRWC